MAAGARIREIDGIRGIAALTILAGHLCLGYEIRAIPWFWGGVDVFLALSGFLITRILLRDWARPNFIRRYFTRRILRIWPVYYLVLLTTCLFDCLVAKIHSQPIELGYGVLKSALFLQNLEYYFGPQGSSWRTGYPTLFDASWSLAVEEQFYLILPAILALTVGASIRSAMAKARYLKLAILAILLGTLLRLCIPYLGMHLWQLLIGRADGLILGALAALWMHFHSLPADRREQTHFFQRLLAVSAIGTLLLIGLFHYFSIGVMNENPRTSTASAFEVPIMAGLGVSLVALSVLDTGAAYLAIFRIRPLTMIGVISYSLYLWHIPLIVVFSIRIRQLLPSPVSNGWVFPVLITLILTVSWLSYVIIEKPALSFKKQFE